MAGLIIDDVAGLKPPYYNSAYLIEGSGYELVCRKLKDDFAGNYRTCPTPDVKNPIDCGDVSIAALICRDSECQDHKDLDRRDKLLKKMRKPNNRYQVVCVPAFMQEHFHLGGPLLGSYNVVLANSNPSGQGSFIAGRGKKVDNDVLGEKNVVLVKAFDKLATGRPDHEPLSASREERH